MIRNVLDRGTALLTVLPDRHDTIACISSVSKYNIFEADAIKMIKLILICHPPDSSS